MVIEELIALLGFKVEGAEKAKDFLATLGRVAKRAAKIAASLLAMGAAAATAAFAMVRAITDPLDALLKLSARTGENIQTLQEWKHAAEESGTTVEALARSIEQVNARLEQNVRGQGRAKDVIEQYGLATEGANGEVLRGLGFLEANLAIIQEMTASEQADFAKQFGITPDVINLLQAGAEGIAEMREEAHRFGLIMSDAQLAGVEAFNDDVDLLGKATGALSQRLALQLLPSMQVVIDKMKEWWVANLDTLQSLTAFGGNVISAGILSIARIFVLLKDAVVGIGGPILNLLESILGSSSTLNLLLATMAGVLLTLFAPVTATALAFLLVLDDIAAWWEGSPSITGDAIDAIKSGWGGLTAFFTETFGSLSSKFSELWDSLSSGVGNYISKSTMGFNEMLSTAGTVAGGIKDFFLSIPNAIMGAFDTMVEYVADKLSYLKSLVSGISISLPGLSSLQQFGSDAFDFVTGNSGTGVDGAEVTNNQNNLDVQNRTEINTQVDVTLPEGAGVLSGLPGQIANSVAGVNEQNNQSINSAAEAIGAD